MPRDASLFRKLDRMGAPHRKNKPIEDVYPNKSKYKPGTNFRTRRNSPWLPWLDRKHLCIVPATAFAEPDRNTPRGAMMWRWFKRADGVPFFFAGI